MKKFLKIFLISVLSLLVFILAAAFIIPVVFKEDIIEAVKDAAHENLDAEINFEADGFNLSLFSHFPDITMEINDLSIVGKGDFKGDTLMAFKSFNVGLDLWSVISGDKMTVNGIYLDQPLIQGLVNKDGKPNWDIYIGESDTTTVEEDTTASKFSIAIKEWAITDARIIYDDKPGDTYAEIIGLTHTGGGDFNEETFLLETMTTIKEISAEYGGITYLNKNTFEAKMDLEISDNYSKYTFKENLLTLNEFAFGFDGWLLLAEEYMDIDMTFEAKETEFKNILSLVPAVFLTDFDKIETSGKLAFNGAAKGKMEEDKIPAFDLTLLVNDGYFKYPDLPSAVSNINIDFNTACKDGVIDNMVVNLKKFHMMFGKNPVDAKALVEGLTDMNIDAKVNAQFNLADVATFYPMDGIKLKGLFSLDLLAKGNYNEAAGTLPSINAGLGLKNGFVSVEGAPEMSNILIASSLNVPGGNVAAGSFELSHLDFVLQDQKFHTDAKVNNFENYTFSGNANGMLDLNKLMALYPLEGMTLKGLIDIHNVSFKGTQEAIDAERYQDVKVGGDMSFKEFGYYDNEYLPNGFTIKEGNVTFTPERMNIESASGYLSKSDYKISGYVSNYMGYVFSEDDSVLVGKMSMYSKAFDVDEWMYEDPEAAAQASTEEEEPLEIVPLPENIDFVFNAVIDSVIYDDMGITDMVGQVVMKNATVCLNNTKFNALGGRFVVNGCHSTQDLDHPTYQFAMKIDSMQFKKAYETFSFLKEYIPGLKSIEGLFNAEYKILGELDQEYMPLYDKIEAKGVADILNAKLTEADFITKLANMADLRSENQAGNQDVEVNDTKVGFRIEDGKAIFNPFKAKAGDMDMTINGKNGLDGSIEYDLDMLVPSGMVGDMANSAASKYLGKSSVVGDKMNMKAQIVGTYDNPKIKLLGKDGTSTTATIADAGKKAVENEVKNQVSKTKAQVSEECLQEAEKQGKQIMATAEKNAEKVTYEAKLSGDKIRKEGDIQAKKLRDEAKWQAEDLVKEAKNPIAKKLAEESGKTIIKEADKQAKTVEKEANEEASKVENTAKKEADKIMSDAQAEVDKLKAECNQ